MQKEVNVSRFMVRMLFGGIIGGICWGAIYYLTLVGSEFRVYLSQFVSVGWILGFSISFLTAIMFIAITNGKSYSQKTIYITIFAMVMLTACPAWIVFFFFSPSLNHLLFNYAVVIIGEYLLLQYSVYKKIPLQQ
jgi:hypothetical protein